ncbi:hypothetical protein SBOR_9217 [Sclerotinia borealis F-4128]|uniref:AAA+ ATPase domain-containing protein n=1 Tax=Sclerotinia borealis (strain F-4128) TaxID=1432307 RepID=W9C3G3_SCLBF|nr:hypothetical protein SBOR_9217 [Sclerotinia borealis F-4128]
MATPSLGLSKMATPMRLFVRKVPEINCAKTTLSSARMLSTRSISAPSARSHIDSLSLSLRNTFISVPKLISTANLTVPASSILAMAHGRQMSMFSSLRSQTHRPVTKFSQTQQRSLFGGSMSHNLLSHLEETANKNPKSATAQNAFYQALLKANMPAIIADRYQTGHFASNPTCESAYHRALGMLGQMNGGGMVTPSGQSGNLGNAQTQAIGQAVAAHSRGGNIAISRGQASGSGDKITPMHVIVDESTGSAVFKWVKFGLYFGLFTYFSLVVVSIMIETFNSFVRARPGGAKTDNEAKAEHQNVRFTDVHGCDEAKDELQELVDFLKNPEKFSTLGGKLPKGVLLVGPPGTGKTLLARAVAGEAGVPFFFMSGSEFDEIYVGVGAKRVRELFASAKGKSPAIIFIDELDAIGGKRNSRDAAHTKQTLNQLLTELDGFAQNNGVIILAATNFPELLDKALTRPGRFDRNIVVGLPDVRGRLAILKHHMQKIIASSDVNVETLASGTPGFSGAELENIINQAAVHASRAKAKAVSMLDFEWAKDKIMMGAEKRSMVISQKEKEMTAYHEAGHALVLMFTPGTDPLHKVTIMPRGNALGITFHLPAMDKYSMSLDEYESRIDVCMGGKVAEEIKYGPMGVTSGVSSDLSSATSLAYNMVTRFGMSPQLGNVDLMTNYEQLSAGTKLLVESEVRRVIEEARLRAVKLIQSKRNELDLLAKALMDYETLDRDEAFKVVRGEKLEGRAILPSGSIIKVPEGMATILAPIPGSEPVDKGPKGPPGGGALA